MSLADAVADKLTDTHTIVWVVSDDTRGETYNPRVFWKAEDARACLREWVGDFTVGDPQLQAAAFGEVASNPDSWNDGDAESYRIVSRYIE